MSKLINMIKKNHGKDKDEVDRDFSVNMAAVEALGEIPVGNEAAIEALILILTQLKAIWPARHIPCIETVLSSMGRTAFESESQSAETARSLVFRNFLHLSHQLLFEGVHEWQPRRRPDWKKIMIPLARRLVQRNGIPLFLSPKVMKHVVSQLRRSSYIKEKRIYQDFPYFDFACGERLHPQAVRLALRELLVASGNDLSLVLPLLSHPHDHSLRASAAYIILRRGHDAVDDVLVGLKGDGRQEILEAIVDTLLVMRESMPHMDKVVPALEELIEDDDFWIRRSVLFALWVAKHPPLEMTRAWISSTAVEAEAALDAIDPDVQDLICDALQHFDSEIRWMALMKLMTFHELPTSLQSLALDRKTGKLTNNQIPTPSRTRLDGGDVTVEQIQKLLLNPDEQPHVLRLSMGILYGLARAEHPKSLEVLQLLTDARRQYPYAMAVAILDNLKEPLPLHLPEKQWKSSSVKAIEDKVKKWADPTYYDRMAEQIQGVVAFFDDPKSCQRQLDLSRSNRLFLCQAVPGCIAWSTVTTFVPDYLHKEQGLSVESATLLVSFFGASCLLWALVGAALGQRIYHRNRGHLPYLMASCTSFAVCPFLLLINSNPEALISQTDAAQGAWPSPWALSLAFLGGAAAVTNPNLKGLLMNVNSSATRGTVFALVTLTDDVGKGLGPEVVAIIVSAMGRRWALSAAISCWLVCAVLLYFSRWTLVKDVLRVERLEKLPAAAVLFGMVKGQEIPWRLSVLFNGMRVRDRSFERLFNTPLDLPCLMVFGRQDEFYRYGKMSQVALYEDPWVLEHDEGHKFPSAAPRAREIYDEVITRIREVCGLIKK
eukprot:symbB.v1.2.000150.t1/scaffold9.1/size550961/6